MEEPIIDIEWLEEKDREESSLCVVRLKTSSYHTKRGVFQLRSLIFMKRLSGKGYNVLKEDVDNVGADQALGNVTNLNECKDGLYQVLAYNFTTDWETGYVDGWELKLVPYVAQKSA